MFVCELECTSLQETSNYNNENNVLRSVSDVSPHELLATSGSSHTSTESHTSFSRVFSQSKATSRPGVSRGPPNSIGTIWMSHPLNSSPSCGSAARHRQENSTRPHSSPHSEGALLAGSPQLALNRTTSSPSPSFPK